jgi:hypothetical protein
MQVPSLQSLTNRNLTVKKHKKGKISITLEKTRALSSKQATQAMLRIHRAPTLKRTR